MPYIIQKSSVYTPSSSNQSINVPCYLCLLTVFVVMMLRYVRTAALSRERQVLYGCLLHAARGYEG